MSATAAGSPDAEKSPLATDATADGALSPNSLEPAADGDRESRDFAVAMAAIAAETRGSDICVLHVAPLIYWTRYMVSV